MFRFLHSSDLHLGKAFGGYPEGIRNRLREARHGAIARLAQAARDGGANVVLLAGDTFDAETPAPDTLRHALRAMAAEADITWIMLPGNHDSLAATELWRRIAADAPANLRPITTAEPFEIMPGAMLLPAPCTQRRPGRDLTEAMAAATPEGCLRIGLGHGAISDFSGEEGAPGIIAPDRARLAGLDYLALGDWHGQMQVNPTTRYSGTPEADGFKHATASGALLVTLDGGAEIRPVETGSLGWQTLTLDLLPGDDPVGRLAQALPLPMLRRNLLLRLVVSGRLPLASRAALEAEARAVGPDFGWFHHDLSGLATEAHPDDLDEIDRAGALRQAAEVLLAEAGDPTRAQSERDIASAALARLYALAREVQA
ncbi:metallophosphoesterase family protein [Paracoccus benzoatiresistens]|uniref:DNA repair exonuclease n=1 Tax=Paracoccus benzoatiresistens TaxID=2997341 RepID=A0ABT4J5R7_9RHOB|nr:DNA repair exonuclease [Paracoccus sp. EF6]MCZ0962470.1 DNA repair exonuclease [Paracoccus sp. EF6]